MLEESQEENKEPFSNESGGIQTLETEKEKKIQKYV